MRLKKHSMSKPLISIIIPCYNQAQYLDECLQSVMDQTYQNWECIIVNDGSIDNTKEIAESWTNKDYRFIYLEKENGGVSSARNFGIERSDGEWILPLDGDDKIGIRYLELAEKQFNSGYTLIYCKANFFGTINKEWNLVDYSYNEMLLHNLIFCSVFFTKKTFMESKGYDVNLIYGLEDWDFLLTVLDENKKVLKLDYIGFYYRRNEISRDVVINTDKIKLSHSENYIYKKHHQKYEQRFGNFFDIQREISNLKYKIQDLEFHNERLMSIINEPFLLKIKRKLLK